MKILITNLAPPIRPFEGKITNHRLCRKELDRFMAKTQSVRNRVLKTTYYI